MEKRGEMVVGAIFRFIGKVGKSYLGILAFAARISNCNL
jgi:hypothetical protein